MPDATRAEPPTSRILPAPGRTGPREPEDDLSSATRLWLRRLPAERRPLGLCDQFPRLANQLASCWADPVLREPMLDELLQDRRGGHEGFPPGVERELQRLREFDARQHHGLPGPPWWRAMVKAVRS